APPAGGSLGHARRVRTAQARGRGHGHPARGSRATRSELVPRRHAVPAGERCAGGRPLGGVSPPTSVRTRRRADRASHAPPAGAEVVEEESACKPDPVRPPRGGPATISLGALAPRRRSPAPCDLPGSSDGPSSNAPCLALLRVGLAEPARSPAPLVSSYLTVSPLPRATDRCGGLSLLRFREVAPAWVSPAPCPAESGLSSTDPKIDRGRPAGSSVREHTAGARAPAGPDASVDSAFRCASDRSPPC